MAQVIKEIQLEVSKPNFIQAIVAKQFDSKSRWLRVQLVDNGEKITVADTSAVTINARRSDGGEKKFAGSVDKGKGTVLVPLSAWMLQLEGTVKSDVSVTDTSGRILTTTNFTIEVERASCQDSGVSEDDANIDILTQLILDVQSIKPDTTYNPESTNAQSGIAVAQALENLQTENTIIAGSTNPVSGGAVKKYVDDEISGVEKSVEEISSVFNKSANIYNEKTNIVGMVISSSGVETANGQYTTTDFIYLETGLYIMTYEDTNKFSYMSTYNTDKVFSNRKEISSNSYFIKNENSAMFEITSPCYVRFSGNARNMPQNQIMLVKGTTLPTEYVPYVSEIKSEYVPTDNQYNAESKKPQSGIAVAQAVEIAKEEILSSVAKNKSDGVSVEDLFDFSPNLYNKDTNTVGIAISTTGTETTNASYSVTDFIYLDVGTYVMTCEDMKKFAHMVKYDLNKTFTSRTDVKSGEGEIVITEPCYVRFNGLTPRITEIMLNKGTELLPYEPYWVKLKPDNMYDITNDKIADGTLTKEKTDFFKTSSNLINRMTLEKGYVISATGVKTENSAYSITNKMLLKSNAEYTQHDCFRISYFDENDKHIVSTEFGNTATFTTPVTFAYAIISLRHDTASVKRHWQLNEGNTLLPYEPQHLVIDGYRIYDEPDVDVDPVKVFALKDRVVFDKSPLFTLDTDEGINGVTDNDRGVDAIYSHYDNLMAENPNYIKKSTISNNGGTFSLPYYEFKNPDKYHTQPNYSTAVPKVILISGVHGEYSGIYSLFNAMKQITSNPKLQHLKNEIHFIVVPVVNVYGLTNSTRTNENGVDIARNFEIGWEASVDVNTKGTSPLSEKESQCIDNLLKANTDAICFTSCHSMQGGEGSTGFIWGALATTYYTNLCNKLLGKLSAEWVKKYDFITQTIDGYVVGNNSNYIGYCDVSAPAGSEGKQATKYGIHGGTLEVCDYFHFPEYRSHHLDSFVISRGTETYINWIMLNVYNYDPNF